MDYKKTLLNISKVANYKLKIALGEQFEPSEKFMEKFQSVYESFANKNEVKNLTKAYSAYKKGLTRNEIEAKNNFNIKLTELTDKMFKTIGFTEGEEGGKKKPKILDKEPFKSQMGVIADFIIPKLVKQINKEGKPTNKQKGDIESVIGTMITSFKKYPNVNDNKIASSLSSLKADRKVDLKKLKVEVFSEATRQEVLKRASGIKTEEGFDIAIKRATTRAESKILEDAKRDYMGTDEFKEKQKATLAAKAEKMNTLINRKAQVRLKMKDFNYSNLTTAEDKQKFLEETKKLPADRESNSIRDFVVSDIIQTKKQEKAAAQSAQAAANLTASQAAVSQKQKDDQDKLDGKEDIRTMDKALLDEKLAELEGKETLTVKETAMVQPLKDRIKGEKALSIQEENNRIIREQNEAEKTKLAEARRGKKAAAIQEDIEGKQAAATKAKATKAQQKIEKQEKIEKLIAEQNERERTTLETRNRATKQTVFMNNYIGQMADQGRAQRLQNAITKFGAINDPEPKRDNSGSLLKGETTIAQKKKNRLRRLLYKFANPNFSPQDREIAGDLAVHLFGKDEDKSTILTEGTAAATTNATIRTKLDRYRTELETTGRINRGLDRRQGKDIKGFLNRPTKDQELTNPQTPRQELRQGREIAIAGRAMNEAVGGGGVAGESEGDRQARVRGERLTESQSDSGGDRVGRGNEGIISQADMNRDYPRRVKPALGTTARQAETAKTVQRTAEYKRQWSAMGTTVSSMNLDERLIKEIEGTEGLEGEQQRSIRESAINYRDTRRFIERNQGAINADFAQMAVNSGHLVGIGGEFGGNFYDADEDFAKGDYKQSLLDDIAAGNNVVQVYSNGMNLTTIPTTTRMNRYYTAGQGGVSLGNIASVVRAAQMDKIVYYAHTYPSGANFAQGIGMDINQPDIDTKATSAGNLKITDLRDKFPFTGREDYKSGSMFGREEVNLGTASNVVKIDAQNLKVSFGPEFNGVILHKGLTRLDAWERRGRPEYIEAEGDPIGGGYVGGFDKLYVKKGKGFTKVGDTVREGEYASGGFYSAQQDLANARRDQRIRQTKYLYPYKQKKPIATLRK